ncbi:MAG: hypothetical protein ACI9NN_000042 [Bacteroidia bacterium]|jgi:hypothetical protein
MSFQTNILLPHDIVIYTLVKNSNVFICPQTVFRFEKSNEFAHRIMSRKRKKASVWQLNIDFDIMN